MYHHLALLSCAVLALATLGTSYGAQRTFVSTSGVDNPACSLSAPCRQFAAAITATAAGGEIIVLDSGGYGRATITQSVTIEAPPGIYAGISVFPGTNGIDINAPFATVRLRGLTINGQGGDNGINVTGVGELRIDRCRITGMSGIGIVVSSAVVVGITQSELSGNIGNAIQAIGAFDLFVGGVVIERNFSLAMLLGGGLRAVLHDVLAQSNHSSGIYGEAGPTATPTVIHADRIEVSGNLGTGIGMVGIAGGLGTLTIARSSFHDNENGNVSGSGDAGPITVTVTDSVISGKSTTGYGIAVGGANGRMVASRNVVVDNGGFGFHNLEGGAIFESTGDNVLRNNNGGGPQTNGAITIIGGT